MSWMKKDYAREKQRRNIHESPERTPRRERSHQMKKQFDNQEVSVESQFSEDDYDQSGLISDRQWERLRRATLRGIGLDIE